VPIAGVIVITYFYGQLASLLPAVLWALAFFVLSVDILLHFRGPSVGEHDLKRYHLLLEKLHGEYRRSAKK
jgi:hypothetical protein